MINRELIRLKVVQLVYAYYQNEGKTQDVAEKELHFSLQKAYELYKYLLNTLVEIRRYAERRVEGSRHRAQLMKSGGADIADVRLAENKLLLMLEDNKALADYRETKSDWEEEPMLIKSLYNAFVESEAFKEYLDGGENSFESERRIICVLYKKVIAENEELDDVLEVHSLYWNDDRHVVDTFVMKTLKRFAETTSPEQPLLPDYDSERDRAFAVTLFRETILRADETRRYIADNCKNWEYSRLAMMDVVIMQIALTEMLVFPEIPATVTISEYLDLARVYSTPRSPGYINGLLDHILKAMREEGILMK